MSQQDSHPLASSWKQPQNSRLSLQIYNTFTRTKVPFVPKDGNTVRWYNCGPTVYDASHIGHARNYVTFDIIRRIMEDYFTFDVTLVMNITDIDDKIIIRARQGYLVNQFRLKHQLIDSSLLAELKKIWNSYVENKLGSGDEAAWKALELQMSSINSTNEESDAKRLMHFNNCRKALEALNSAVVGSDSKDLIDSFVDILAVDLDAKFGAEITDQKIFRDLAAHWERDFLIDMKSLNVRPVSLMTRVTEFVPQVIQCVEQIIANGYAYESEGSVYFDVSSFHDKKGHIYAKLCPWSAGNCKFFEEGEGALGVKLGGKRDPRDFALWKASKAGEPQWDSPWGPGRPGWHIECSAMAAAVAPGTLDIHSGGIDLAFPHHDNELAQSEAFYESSQWVNYFMHAGHVHIEGHKMSKSLKNFITIKDALERYTSRQLRIMFLQHQWHAAVFYKESSMTTAIAVEQQFVNFFANISAHLRSAADAPPCVVSAPELELINLLDRTKSQVHEFLCDNFDTPSVLQKLQDLINATNIYIQNQSEPNAYVLKMSAKFITKILRIFGVINNANDECVGFESSTSSNGDDIWSTIGPVLENVAEFRDSIRATALARNDSNDFLTICDNLRKNLLDHGVVFEDRVNKITLVKLVDKETLSRMKSEQSDRDAEKLARKMEMSRINEQKLAEKRSKAAIDPKTMFRTEAYGAWDENGVPTHDANGVELSKNARKKLLKEYEAQVELRQKFVDV